MQTGIRLAHVTQESWLGGVKTVEILLESKASVLPLRATEAMDTEVSGDDHVTIWTHLLSG